jgi:hypothetical protein
MVCTLDNDDAKYSISLPDLAVAIAMAIQGIAVGFYLLRGVRGKLLGGTIPKPASAQTTQVNFCRIFKFSNPSDRKGDSFKRWSPQHEA